MTGRRKWKWKAYTIISVISIYYTLTILLLNDKRPKLNDKDISTITSPRETVSYQERYVVRTRDQSIKEHEYGYNLTAGDLLALNRRILDTRPQICRNRTYRILDDNITVSIIIPFYNEAVSTLVRTIYSILNRTPCRFLKEIILVNDKSTHIALVKNLEEELQRLGHRRSFVKLLQISKQRVGLIKARLKGASIAKGKILAFLDAHTEVNKGWIEPHLDILQSNHQLVLQPFIDSIDLNTMQYTNASRVFKGAFTWDLRYVWMKTPEYQEKFIFRTAQAFETPVLVGCVIIVRKDYFFKIGSFDSGMSIWGGENIDLSLRTWLCGGGAMIVPCSRVGHLFRNVPYKDSQFQINWQTNLHRVADVWLDRFAKFYFSSISFYNYNIKRDEYYNRTIQERFNLKKKLKCRPFDWFLKTVYPQFPVPDSNVIFIGEIRNKKSSLCWMISGNYIKLGECNYYQINLENQFTLKSNGLLMHSDRCVIMNLRQPFLLLDSCPAGSPDENYGIWHMEIKEYSRGYLKLRKKIGQWPVNERCAVQVTSVGQVMKKMQIPQVQKCLPVAQQIWSFTNRFVY